MNVFVQAQMEFSNEHRFEHFSDSQRVRDFGDFRVIDRMHNIQI